MIYESRYHRRSHSTAVGSTPRAIEMCTTYAPRRKSPLEPTGVSLRYWRTALADEEIVAVALLDLPQVSIRTGSQQRCTTIEANYWMKTCVIYEGHN